ncbi:hypothetical protein L1D55_17685 [Vibrio sp. Isolate22]|uniref:hypothetical protein n=1 Tax=Vibrio sp. Isolate22 TaxID=2908532 RepID=UPI001EFD0E5B|nr:hypothetical protein [Vibrio sp. Isolate22]MCG9693555.1 hypothetical protein [Vibrio sp. Isolate22]
MPNSGLTLIQKDMLSLFANADLVGVTKIDKVKIAVAAATEVDSLTGTITEAVTGSGTSLAGMIENITEQIKEKFLDYAKSITSIAMDDIKAQILSMIPSLVKKIFADLAPAIDDIKEAASRIYSALGKAVNNHKTRHLSSMTTTRVGADVIDKIRGEIRAVAVQDSMIALAHGGVIAINLASSGIGAAVTSIVKAVLSIFNFFRGLYDKWVMERKFRKFKQECLMLNQKRDVIGANFFRDWFKMKMEEIPVIASYMVCMPCYSSPYNFLSITDITPPPPNMKTRLTRRIKRKFCFKVNTDPSVIKLSFQKSTLSAYATLQEEAKAFIANSEIALESNKPGVKQVLNAARGEPNFIPGTDEKAFTKVVRKQQVKNFFNGTTIKESVKESLAPKALAATVAGGLESLLVPE